MFTLMQKAPTTHLPPEMFTGTGNSSYVNDDELSSIMSINKSSLSHAFDASCHGTDAEDAMVMSSLVVYLAASLVFVAVGLIGNSLSIAVFTSRDMRAISSNVYLLVLAISDSLYLVTVFMSRLLPIARCWYFRHVPADVGNRSQFMCVTLQYLSDLFSDYSTCLILAFTVERGMAVFCPIAFKERCTVSRARLVCTSMFSAIAVIICPYHVIMMQLYIEYNVCAIVQLFDEWFAILYAVEMVTLRVVPVVGIAFLNAFIIVRVTRLTRDKNRRRQRLMSSVGNETVDVIDGRGGRGTDHLRLMTVNDDVIVQGNDQRIQRNTDYHQQTQPHQPHPRRHQQQQRRSCIDDRSLQLTIILILVSSSYILAYIPVLMHFVMVKMKMNSWIGTSEETLAIFGNYSKTLYIGGFAINFFLYTMSGRVFRDQLCHILCSARTLRSGRGKRRFGTRYVSACAGGGCGRTLETVVNTAAEATSMV